MDRVVVLRAAVYIRVSTDSQLDGNSLSTQEETCCNYVERSGWQLTEVYRDGGFSGATMERPALQRLLADSKEGLFDIVVVWSIDRLGRSLRHAVNIAADLEERRIYCVSVSQGFDTTSLGGKMSFGFYSVLGEMERSIIVERTFPNMKKGAESGKWQGGPPPYGYRLQEGKFIVEPVEAAIVREIFAQCQFGTGVKRIAVALNARGVQKDSGFAWSGTHIHKILRQEMYMGHLVWNRTTTKSKRPTALSDRVVVLNQHEAIIDEETFATVQKLLTGRALHHTTRNLDSPYLLTGVFHCAKCGAKMVGSNRRVNNRTKAQRRTYICSAKHYGNGNCVTNSIDAELVEAEALRLIADAAREPTIVAEVRRHLERMAGQSADPSRNHELKQLQQELATTERRLKKCFDLLLDDKPDDAFAKAQYEQLNVDCEQLKTKIARLEARLYGAGTHQAKVAEVLTLLDNLHIVWDALNLEERKQVFHTVFERIEANDGSVVSVTASEEFLSFIKLLDEPVWCLMHKRNIRELNEEIFTLRGAKTIKAFAAELGLSATYLGDVERGFSPMSDFVREKVEAWKLHQGEQRGGAPCM